MDKVDEQLLNRVKEKSGEQVYKLLRTLDCRTVKTLRRRLDELETAGYVILDRTTYRGQVRVSITPFGEETLAAIKGRAESAPLTEATP